MQAQSLGPDASFSVLYSLLCQVGLTIDILTRRGMGNFNYSSIQMYYVTSRGLSQRALSRLERATMAAN